MVMEMKKMAAQASSSRLANYKPKKLVTPILAAPKRPGFIDEKTRLQQIVSDNFLPPGLLSKKYRYSPLRDDEVRLLFLEPGEGDSPIRCEMVYGSLDDPAINQQYLALSYHWGTDNPTNQITIIDNRTPRKDAFASTVLQLTKSGDTANNEWWFQVRHNLLRALRGLRSKTEPLLIWVDAICINQDPKDDRAKAEKRQQVNNMWQIYGRAYSVCIWLGDSTAQTDRAMSFIKKVVTDIPGVDDYFLHEDKQLDDWLAFRELLTFRWFSRRWVVQEVALARNATVHCGNMSLDWDDFADGIALFVNRMEQVNRAQQMMNLTKNRSKLEDVAALGANALVSMLSNLTRKNETGDIMERLIGIETLVSTLLFFEASNPHDYIFSLLALARDTRKLGSLEPSGVLSPGGSSCGMVNIEVDYEKDPLELFKDFTAQCVESSRSLDIICRHWAPDVEGKDPDGSTKEVAFPSWILKVSQSAYGTAQDTLEGRRVGDSLVGVPYRDTRKTYNAANGTEAIFGFGMAPDQCLVRRFTDLSDASYDSLSTRGLDMSRTFSRNQTLNDLQGQGMDERDFAQANIGRILEEKCSVEEPSEFHERKDSGAFTRPSSTRTPSNTSFAPGIARNVLYVMGVQLGRIKQRSNRMTNGTVPVEWLRATGWELENPGRVPDVLWRTLVADRGPDRQFPPRWYRRACSHCLCDPELMTPNKDLDTQKTPSSAIMAQFLKRVRSVVYSRQFFYGGTNDQPLFGLAPPSAQKGDLICVFAGCTVPVIIRKKRADDGSCHFEFIGEAYVYGKMDGEAMSGFSCSDPQELRNQLLCFPLV